MVFFFFLEARATHGPGLSVTESVGQSVCLQIFVPYGQVWSHMVPYGPLWSCMAPYGSVWSYMFWYGYVLSRMVVYDTLWSCVVFEILSSPITLLSPVRYQILADIESFVFLF